MKKEILFFSLFSLINTKIYSQVKVGDNPNNINPSAVLEIESSNKGFLPPRVALTGTNDLTTVSTPANGLLVYNTSNAGITPNNVIPGFYYFNGSVWVSIVNQTINGISSSGSSIKLGGPIIESTNISNLTDTSYLSFDGNGTNIFKIDTSTFSVDAINNRVGIGTNSPKVTLDVIGQIKAVENVEITRYNSGGANPASLTLKKSQSSLTGIDLPMLSGQMIGEIRFTGFNGTNYPTRPASIRVSSTEGFSSTGNGTKMDFQTSSNGTITPISRFTIDQSGYIGVGQSNPTNYFHIQKPSNVIDDNTTQGMMLLLNSTPLVQGQMAGISFRANSGLNGIWKIGSEQTSATNTGNSDFVFYRRINSTAPNELKMILHRDGNVGIGNNYNPSEKLDVSGNVKFSGALMPNNTAGTAGQVLTSAGAGLPPTWTTPSEGNGNVNASNSLVLGITSVSNDKPVIFGDGTSVLSLPDPTTNTGRIIFIRNTSTGLNQSVLGVIDYNSTTASTFSITPAIGSITVVSNGTGWYRIN